MPQMTIEQLRGVGVDMAKGESKTITSAEYKAMLAKPKKKKSKAYEIEPHVFGYYGVPQATIEFRFHTVRKWRIDFAWPNVKLAMEIEGGLFIQGRHGRGGNYRKDCEKYNALAEAGWTLLRYLPKEIDWQQVRRVHDRLCGIRV